MNDIIKLIGLTQDLKLLYVEDNMDARESTSIMLEDFFDDIEVALDGAEGLEKFKNAHFDIVITDINMPNMTGIQMIEKIREIDTQVPLVLLSAYASKQYEKEIKQFNIKGFLLKPLMLDKFVKQISLAIDVEL